ncbi:MULTISPECIES: helix-turn-helix domain-containing protein [Streptomyces]|uniref:Helix-turn-helix domain-containing protein n=1 Tax=Streptomyces morookaense TaxID=1970 RepID=A0A7Y7AZQ2_STRMO|nr:MULTISPECIES: helix-turn-helix transcriptional regulator [Streptomyces]MCC2276710.1 helix-turn-helix domain-containing protein [Streptomyces sp. ET3-23]NVK76355.1 helix-turn-helix domain-containing protein [Streptomyces morookaense]GHF39238.1 transcriptional regulator [Streptomyces morookaense]
MGGKPPPTIRQRRLGAELRRLREAAGMSGEDAAAALECGQAKISRIETGANGIRPFELRGLLKVYGVTDRELVESLVEMAKEGRRQGWWNQYAKTFPGIVDLAHLESTAVRIRTWQTVLVPGLLQVPGYMRALFRRGRRAYTEAQVEQCVEARTARQQIFEKADPPEYRAVLYEAVLRSCVGGETVMRRQLEHIAGLAESGRVSVRVVPFGSGAHGGLDGSFVLYGAACPGMDVVLMDGLAGTTHLDQDEEVQRYRGVFDGLTTLALDPARSLEMIRQHAVRP